MDEALRADADSRVAIEILAISDQVVIAGEVTCLKNPDFVKIARKQTKRLGYTDGIHNFSDQSKIQLPEW